MKKMYEIQSKSGFQTGVSLQVNVPEEEVDKKVLLDAKHTKKTMQAPLNVKPDTKASKAKAEKKEKAGKAKFAHDRKRDLFGRKKLLEQRIIQGAATMQAMRAIQAMLATRVTQATPGSMRRQL